MPYLLPVMWALLGPSLPTPPELPLPTLPTLVDVERPPAPSQGAEALAGWHAVVGGALGLAAGTGAPVAVVAGGSGVLAWMYTQAFAGALSGIVPALLALATAETMLGAALLFPLCGSVLAIAGVTWGAQREGRDPMAAFVGGSPGLALAFTATALAAVAIGIGLLGFANLVPALAVGLVALLVGLPAPAVAYVGATLGDVLWPGVRDTLQRHRPDADIVKTQPGMAY